MFLSKKLLNLLFGSNTMLKQDPLKSRRQIIEFPPVDDGDEYMELKFRSSDGLILCLLKRVEKSEERIRKLENNIKTTKKLTK